VEKQQRQKKYFIVFISFTFWKVNVSQFLLKSKYMTMNMFLRGFRSSILYCDLILVAEKFLFIYISQVNSIFPIIFIFLIWLLIFTGLPLTLYYIILQTVEWNFHSFECCGKVLLGCRMHEVTCVDSFFIQACLLKFHFLRQAIELQIVWSRNEIKESTGGTFIWLVFEPSWCSDLLP